MYTKNRLFRVAGTLGLLSTFALGPTHSALAAGLTTQSGLTGANLANSLVGAGVNISNVVYTGTSISGGKFAGGTGIIGFEGGVILSSGNVASIVGPNKSDSTSTSLGTGGDADLNAISGKTTMDATKLEFDFVPDADKVFFQYVFASEEYNEYVKTSFNDAFAFFINGQNCAKLPDGSPVTIDNVNLGKNAAYYRNNDLSDGGGSINTEMDGLTVVLDCEAPVNKGVANHIKLVVADSSDRILDSVVFLRGGSFSTTPPEVCGDKIDNDGDGQVDEGCPTNQPPTPNAGPDIAGDEGSSIALSGSAPDPDTTDTVTTSWSFTPGAGVDPGATCSIVDTSALNTTITCTDDGVYTVTLTANDGTNPAVKDSADITVGNVAPTITSLTASAFQALKGKAVTFNATATDPGSNDSISYEWSVDGGAYTAGTSSFQTSFTTCGSHTVSVNALDDDNGVSAPALLASPVSVYEAHFLQPVDEGTFNTVQKGRVIPVKISLGCNGTSLTGLNPAIQLLKGDKSDASETGADDIETVSSSAADTTGIMRAADGHYMYNLQVPNDSSATVGALYTIRVRPFGDSNPGASMYAVLKIRK